MKTIFTLLLILFSISLVQSTFTPDRTNCGGTHNWRTDNITLDNPPVAGQNSTFHICGTNPNYYVILFEQIRATSGTLINVTYNNFTSVYWRNSECFDLTFQIPQGSPQQMFVRFDLIGVPKDIGCANVTLNLTNGTKFLRRYF